MYVHVLGTKGSQEASTHMGKLFRESNNIDGSHISQLLAQFMAFSIFYDTLYGKNRLGISLFIYVGQKAP